MMSGASLTFPMTWLTLLFFPIGAMADALLPPMETFLTETHDVENFKNLEASLGSLAKLSQQLKVQTAVIEEIETSQRKPTLESFLSESHIGGVPSYGIKPPIPYASPPIGHQGSVPSNSGQHQQLGSFGAQPPLNTPPVYQHSTLQNVHQAPVNNLPNVHQAPVNNLPNVNRAPVNNLPNVHPLPINNYPSAQQHPIGGQSPLFHPSGPVHSSPSYGSQPHIPRSPSQTQITRRLPGNVPSYVPPRQPMPAFGRPIGASRPIGSGLPPYPHPRSPGGFDIAEFEIDFSKMYKEMEEAKQERILKNQQSGPNIAPDSSVDKLLDKSDTESNEDSTTTPDFEQTECTDTETSVTTDSLGEDETTECTDTETSVTTDSPGEDKTTECTDSETSVTTGSPGEEETDCTDDSSPEGPSDAPVNDEERCPEVTPAPPQDICGENEEFTDCAMSCQETCACKNKGEECTDVCIKGCVCMKGYVLDDRGKCILGTECPMECPPNEKLVDCPSPCSGCEYQSPDACPIKVECKEGCDCIEGYARNKDGNCIPQDQCPVICEKEDEQFYECVPDCKNTCDNFGKDDLVCADICTPGCYCKEGLLKREKDGLCVPEDQCHPCEKDDEQYYECVPSCKNTCDNYANDEYDANDICESGCFCKEGLVKNERDGNCVPPDQCPEPCGLNEVYSDCVSPCNDCEIRGKCEFLVCNEGCDCKENYHRNIDGNCISVEDCPKCENDGERYYVCMPDCENTCLFHSGSVVCSEKGKPGCFCKDGLVKREEDGKCIPPEQCCANTDEQFYECMPDCKNTCRYKTTDIGCSDEKCTPGCFCKDGLVKREDDGKCIPPEQCCANEGEQYYDCVPGCKNTCMYVKSFIECAEQECSPGCYCKDGLVKREDDGKCIPSEQCCESEKEVYYDCMPDCKKSCENINNTVNCAEDCNPGCFCKDGLLRRSDGQCVTPLHCDPEYCEENEMYTDCVNYCNYCDACDCELEECDPGCDCLDGFKRNNEEVCIPVHECPPANCESSSADKDSGNLETIQAIPRA